MNTNPIIHSFYRKLLEEGIKTYSLEFFSFLYKTILEQVRLEQSLHKEYALGKEDTENGEHQEVQQKPYHMSPKKVCALFSDQVSLEYGPWASKVLAQWGIASSLDLGKAVFLLAERGCLTLSGTETLADFEAASLENVE